MEDELYDIKIYEWDDDNNSNSPRRINDGEYHIEWHRKGIKFKQCPEGNIHHSDGMIQKIYVMSGKLVLWDELMGTEYSNELFEYIPIAGTPRYKIRIKKRTVPKWIEWNKKVPNNINTEVMWQLAENEERKWSAQMPSNEIGSTLTELKSNLPPGIDDTVRDLILETWQQRLEQQVIKGLLSDDVNAVSELVPHFKKLIFRNLLPHPDRT